MLKRILNVKYKFVLLYSMIAFLIFGAIYSSVKLSIEIQSLAARQDAVVQHESANLTIQATTINGKASRLVSDILYLMDSYDISLKNHADFDELKSQWLSFSDRIKIFDQIRFIDVNGDERIRINYSDEGAYLVADSALQNKKDRYYFTYTISLSEHEIFVSKMDLNTENGQIEQPVKPTIRLSTPCYSKSGTLLGIIVINYFADDVLSELSATAQSNYGQAFMLNSEGYWIINSESPEKEWAFMYPGQEDVTFASAFPVAWNALKAESSDHIVTDNGVFVFSNVFMSDAYSLNNCGCKIVLNDGDFYLVSYLPPDSAEGALFYQTWFTQLLGILKNNAVVYLLFLMLSVALGLLLSFNQSKQEEIQYFSEYDLLTGVFNRRAGFYNLAKLFKEAPCAEKTISVCFLDINGLKQVNDTLGHDTGDELIVSVANGIKATVRSNDVVARLGGDEFLIVFWDTDETRASSIWERIVAEYTRINETESRPYVISVSCGIETVAPDSKLSIDDVVNLADEKMYANKREIKKGLLVLRESRKAE